MATTTADYPPVAFSFSVHIKAGSDSVDSSWQEVSGLSAEMRTEDLIAGCENSFIYKLPVGTSWGPLVLKRGAPVPRGSKLISWITDAILNFKFDPCFITITLLGPGQTPLMKWDFKYAYPVKWSFTELKSMENAIMIESLELVHQGSQGVTFGTM